MRTWVIAAAITLTAAGQAHAAPVRWVNDPTFAHKVYAVAKGHYPAMEIACLRPLNPTSTMVQKDCLVIAASRTRFFCGEWAWSNNGPLKPRDVPCVIVAKTFAKLKPGTVLSLYPLAEAAPEA